MQYHDRRAPHLGRVFGRRDGDVSRPRRARIAAAAEEQAHQIAYYYNHHFTSEAQWSGWPTACSRRLRDEPRAFRVGRIRANETALQLARLYHVERGDADRWRVISPAQSYHGSTMGTLALSGRSAVQRPHEPYLASHLHFPPSTRRFDPTGKRRSTRSTEHLDEAGPHTVAPLLRARERRGATRGTPPPTRFWDGLAERRDEHGFLICLDEVVTGVGRGGS